ncbi:MAG TPA: hypothetical protein VIX17_22540 [Pyrinomonadaceae bacterium]
MDARRRIGWDRRHRPYLRNVVGLFYDALRTYTTRPSRQIIRLGIQPDADHHMHRRNWCRAARRSLLHRAQARIGPFANMLSVAIPVGMYLSLIYALYTYLIGYFDRFHIWLPLGTAAVLALAIPAADRSLSDFSL